ncbi:transporter substrate-binding domain-containing protein [Kocuria sp. CNJ-770]|uniref:transporter substrate-binding domain-containing protein n=1 Tax=Kocuria sp. CNJ-770 TaxID=1904964 RepID=UPI0021016CC7|nr:transporter substrate-binding domain-containing protein [Kocuria sp. CNJ-770]
MSSSSAAAHAWALAACTASLASSEVIGHIEGSSCQGFPPSSGSSAPTTGGGATRGGSVRDNPPERVYRHGMSLIIRKLIIGLGVVLVLVATGCAASYPADPHKTLERVTGSVLRVGISHNEPFVSVEHPAPSGREVALVEDYASTLDAEVEWTADGEEELVDQLEHGDLDMVIGGLTDKTPWKQKVGLTRPYTQTVDEFGQTEKHVMAVRKGENAFLLDLDEFLQTRGGQQ